MITDFPSDILVLITGELLGNGIDVVRLSQTCKRLHSLLKQTIEFVYATELIVSDYCDDLSSTLTVRERLSLLLEHRARWRTLSWRQRKALTRPFEHNRATQAGFDFLTDVLFNGDLSVGAGVCNPIATVLSQIPTSRYIYRLRIDGEDHEFHKFAVDPSRDLLVLLEGNFPSTSDLMSEDPDDWDYTNNYNAGFTLYLRSLSSKGEEAHPACAQPILSYKFPTYFWDGPKIFSLTLTQSTIGVHAHDGYAACIAIWDCLGGTQLVNMNSTDTGIALQGFCFISPKEFMVSTAYKKRHVGPSLHVFTIGKDFPGAADWEINAGVQHTMCLCLPDLATGCYLHATLCTGPFTRACRTSAPFYPDQKARIFTVRLHSTRTKILLFFHMRDLSRIAREHAMQFRTDSTEKRGPPVVSWSSWGPEYTRMFVQEIPLENPRRFYFLHGPLEPLQGWIHGSRAVCTVGDPRSPGPAVTQVLDFNTPDRYRQPVSATAIPTDSSPSEATLVTEATVVERPDLFKHPVTTSLSYYATPVRDSPLFVGHNGHGYMMLDDGQLYGLKEHWPPAILFQPPNPQAGTVDIDVFSF